MHVLGVCWFTGLSEISSLHLQIWSFAILGVHDEQREKDQGEQSAACLGQKQRLHIDKTRSGRSSLTLFC